MNPDGSNLGVNQYYDHSYRREHAPVIKDLASHDMPTNTPAILISLLPEPMVAQQLRIKIMRLERRMMDM